MGLQGYLAMIRARWAVVAAVTGLALVIAVVASAAATPLYESRAKVFFSVGINPTPGSLARGLEYSGGVWSARTRTSRPPRSSSSR